MTVIRPLLLTEIWKWEKQQNLRKEYSKDEQIPYGFVKSIMREFSFLGELSL